MTLQGRRVGAHECALFPAWAWQYLNSCGVGRLATPRVGPTLQQYRLANKKLYLEWASDYYLLLNARWLSYITFLIHGRYWNMVFVHGFLKFIFGKGDPCLEFSMAVSAGSGTGRPQPTVTSNKFPGINNLEPKHNVRNQSRYSCVLHSRKPSTRSAQQSRVSPRRHWIQIITTRYSPWCTPGTRYQI